MKETHDWLADAKREHSPSAFRLPPHSPEGPHFETTTYAHEPTRLITAGAFHILTKNPVKRLENTGSPCMALYLGSGISALLGANIGCCMGTSTAPGDQLRYNLWVVNPTQELHCIYPLAPKS